MKHLSLRFIFGVLILVSFLTYGLNACNGKSSDQKGSTDSVKIMPMVLVSKGTKMLKVIPDARYFVFKDGGNSDTIWALLWSADTARNAFGKPIIDSATKKPRMNENWINVNPISFSPKDSITVKPL